MYRHATTISEVPVTCLGRMIHALYDFDCALILDADGDLQEVEVLDLAAGDGATIWIGRDGRGEHGRSDAISKAIWEAARKHYDNNRDHIVEMAGVPEPMLPAGLTPAAFRELFGRLA